MADSGAELLPPGTTLPDDPSPASPAVDGPDPKRWLALAVIAIAQLMIILDASIVNVALPAIQTDLGITDANLQWVVTAYTLAFGGLLLFGGRIADFVGRKRQHRAGGQQRRAGLRGDREGPGAGVDAGDGGAGDPEGVAHRRRRAIERAVALVERRGDPLDPLAQRSDAQGSSSKTSTTS